MSDTLSLRIVSLSDDELVRLLSADSEQYREEALAIARAEAVRRNLALDGARPEPKPTSPSLGTALRAFSTGVASQFGPARFSAAGKVIACPHCASDAFEEQTAVVNTRALTLFGLDWLDKGATVLACTRCGLIQWFRIPPSRASL